MLEPTNTILVRCAVFAPLYQEFDYLSDPLAGAVIGGRVSVPFGRSQRIGVVLSFPENSGVDHKKIKAVTAVLDTIPLFSKKELKFLSWIARYYHHPIGEVFSTALPSLLRKGQQPPKPSAEYWLATADANPDIIAKNARKQAEAFTKLHATKKYLAKNSQETITLKKLAEKGLAYSQSEPLVLLPTGGTAPSPVLTEEQKIAINKIQTSTGNFKRWLLHGVTGSGKTEVYINAAQAILNSGKQILILVPEIGLTPQLVSRFEARLNTTIVSLHSALPDKQRALAWQQAKSGEARVVLGTRSAIFTPLPDAGLIIVDEEHDSSFKQFDGLRYNARDLAIVRAQQWNIPCVLGSATPSLETLQASHDGKIETLRLKQRATGMKMPDIKLIDIRGKNLEQGVAAEIWQATEKELTAGNQVLWFLNRRGLAPVLMCHSCGWSAECPDCDGKLTLHSTASNTRLHCHKCCKRSPTPDTCPSCNSMDLNQVGLGTQGLEEKLNSKFKQHNVLRIDRDSIRSKKQLDKALGDIRNGTAQLLVGTQMLAKGHDFPNVTLVAIIDADNGMYSTDFRAIERMAQQVLQVAGRAGRAEKKGHVLLQTHVPQHPVMEHLQTHNYLDICSQQLSERKSTALPPFGAIAMVNADARYSQDAEQFLNQIKLRSSSDDTVEIGFANPATTTKLAGRYRWQLQLWSAEKKALHNTLNHIVSITQEIPLKNGLRWSLDIDPYEN